MLTLRERPTDERAVETLLRAYHDGLAPARLTAVLLGALRAQAAYDFVRNMLETMHGQMVESYAALARAGRVDAMIVSVSLAEDGVDGTWLRELLSSAAEVDLRIGTEVLSSWLHNRNVRSEVEALRESIGPTVERVLALPDFRMARGKRRFLVGWLAHERLPGD